jgi:hypothetical protein
VLHPADEVPAVANLVSQVGAVRGVGNAYPRHRLPSRECWFTLKPGHAQGRAESMLAVLVRRESPVDLLRSLEFEHPRETRRHLELPSGLDEGVVDHLRQDLDVAVPEYELGTARQDGVRDPERSRRQHVSARRALRVADGSARPGKRVVPAARRHGGAELRRSSRPGATMLDDGDGSEGSEERDRGEQENSLFEGRDHGAEVLRKRRTDG